MKKAIVFSLIIIVASFLISLLIYLSAKGKGKSTEKAEPPAMVEKDQSPSPEKEKVTLFFPTWEGFLKPQEQEIEKTANKREKAETILEKLKNPPSGAESPFPIGGEVRKVFITGKMAVIDLQFPSEGMGASQELLTIYSIVNSIIFNIEGIEEVKIVIGGIERETLYGHISLKYPFYMDLSYAGE